VLGILLFQIISRSRRRRGNKEKRRATSSISVGADSEFYQLEQRLAARGLRREIGETLTPWLARTMREPAFRTISQPLHDLVELHYRYRFDPQGLSRAEREKLRRQAQEMSRASRSLELRPSDIARRSRGRRAMTAQFAAGFVANICLAIFIAASCACPCVRRNFSNGPSCFSRENRLRVFEIFLLQLFSLLRELT